jgi:hypothetical protein
VAVRSNLKCRPSEPGVEITSTYVWMRGSGSETEGKGRRTGETILYQSHHAGPYYLTLMELRSIGTAEVIPGDTVATDSERSIPDLWEIRAIWLLPLFPRYCLND